jgi:hypothetical protein
VATIAGYLLAKKALETTKGKTIAILVLILSIVLAFVFMGISFSNYSESPWDKLTDEEKEWYRENGDAIVDFKDAVDDYKKHH